MKAFLTAAVFAALAFSSSAYANGDEPGSDCKAKPCYETVTVKKVIGYKEKVVKIPVYATSKVKKKVACKEDCKPEVVKAEGADIPAPEPKVIEREQKIIVKIKPVVEYVSANVKLAPERPYVVHQQQHVLAPPPPPPAIVQAPACPRPVVSAPCVRCRPVAFRGCPVPSARQRQQFAAIPGAVPGTPGGGYIEGAPRSPQECFDRGGHLAYGGRGCEGYK